MGKSSPPPAPDYAAAARETAAGNAEQALIAQYGSMTNQVTPYGQVNYTSQQVGKTSEGNPLNQWTQTVTMTPEQQALFKQNEAINKQLGDVAQSGVGYVQEAMANPLQGSELQMKLQDPQLLQQQTSDALYKANTQYLDPQFQQTQADLENKLANQGITQGSEAYDRAMGNFQRAKQQAYESARNAAVSGGMQAAQGMFGMGLQGGEFANQAAAQKLAQAQALQQNPINMLNAVRTGSQMQTAQMPQVGVSQAAPLQAVAGPDLLGAAQGQYSAATGANNAANAQSSSALQGGLGAGLALAGMFF